MVKLLLIDNEFEECLNEMYMLVNSYQDKAIVIGGDFNVDISCNTGHTLFLLQQFCLDLSLQFMWDHSRVNSSFTYESSDAMPAVFLITVYVHLFFIVV